MAYPTFCPIQRVTSGLRPYHFTYPERRLTMEEMLYKFIDEGKREHEEMRAFICDFRTTNEILFKERNNSLIELRFGVQELLKVINNTPMIDCEVKGVTTRGGKTTTQDAQNNDTSVHAEEPQAVNHDEPIESNEVLTNDQPQKTSEPVAQPSIKIQTPPIPSSKIKEGKSRGSAEELLRKPEAAPHNYAFHRGPNPNAKILSKQKDPGSFTIPRDIGQLHINNALADPGASISLMPYTIYEKLRLVDKFVLPIDFIILDMPEDSRVPIILGRPFLATARAMIDIFNKKITLRVGDDEVIFDVDQSIKRLPTEDDECYGVYDLDDTINAKAQELLANEEPDSFLSRGLEKSIDQSDLEGCEPVECKTDNDSDSDEPIRRITSINTPYPVMQEITKPFEVERKHLYSVSANEIDEKKPELKDLPHHLEHTYLHGDKSFPIIISSELSKKEKISLLQVLEKQNGAIAWKMSDIKGISPSYCTHKILMEDDFKHVIQPQRRLNPKVQDVVKNEIVKLLDSGLIYPISDNNELIPSRTVIGWRVCIDYRKLNDATQKDHFLLPFIDKMLERLCGNEYYCFLDGFSGFFLIPIAPEDQEKTTFTCLYGTFAYRMIPFGLCNAPATFQRCMTTIFHDMVEDFMKVFMDDFSVFSNSFDYCLANLDRMLARCEETNLVLNWEKYHFMVKEEIVLGHKILGAGIEVDRAKIE
ncbi:DNA-directed DNA polymerase [Tanacetum coccineum]